MQDTLEQLFNITPTLSPKLKKVAKIVLDNPSKIAVSSMRTLAAEAGVTPPTLIRLAEKLGFSSYEGFRSVFQKAIADRNYHERASGLQELAGKEVEGELTHKMTKAAIDNIQTSYRHLKSSALTEAADLIRNAPNTYLIAAGAPHWIAAYIEYVGRMAIPGLVAPRTSGANLMESLIRLSKEDIIVVLSFAPYAKHTNEAAKYAKTQGSTIVYLTDSRAAPLAAEADILLLVATESPQYFPSMTSVIYALETLVACIVSRSDETVINEIAEFDEVQKQHGAYLDTQ